MNKKITRFITQCGGTVEEVKQFTKNSPVFFRVKFHNISFYITETDTYQDIVNILIREAINHGVEQEKDNYKTQVIEFFGRWLSSTA